MKKITLPIYLLLLSITTVFAQNNNPIVFEAESGTFSATTDYETVTDSGVTFVQPKTDLISGDFPGSDDKVITYSVTFPDGGFGLTYDLFVRLYIGPGGGTDDSFFSAAGFGVQNSTEADSWIKINETNRHGYIEPTDILNGEILTADTNNEVWKWINLSKMGKAEAQTAYSVLANNSTFDFQIGAREDGIRFDMFAFGKSDIEYTVADLNSAAGIVLSTKKNTLKSVKVYPNPSSNGFNIKTTEQSVSYKIFNLLGAKVEEGILSLGVKRYGNSLKSGTYILDLQSSNKRSVMKIVKY
ncbi:T9SS type A sorting domain-containing protein [Thalassobellus sediminis]|uniref:T9SS type A sorting domain-containing protein n=1 Tax=Thalassobellus sediminis TaxID=3367753 RepID=UPI0037B0E1D2